MKQRLIVVVMLYIVNAAPTIANEATNNLPAGGLAVDAASGIEIRAQELRISPQAIHIRYTFFNSTAKDVKTTVSFTLPDRPPTDDGSMDSIPVTDATDYLGSQSKVNGTLVETETDERAIVAGVDMTEYLETAKLSPSTATEEELNALPVEMRKTLIELAIIGEEEIEDGEATKKVLVRRWGTRTTIKWEQTFPAEKETVIEHSYQPSVGVSYGASDFSGEYPNSVGYLKKSYCLDEAFLEAAKRMRTETEAKGAFVNEHRVGYLFLKDDKPAALVKDFRLVVDKGDAESLAGFCAPGMKQISPTQYEARAKDYMPSQDLEVLFLIRKQQ